MKWLRFLLLLLFIPSLTHAAFYLKEYQKALDKVSAEWTHHHELIGQFNPLDINAKAQNLHLVHEAIACCQRAIAHYDYILNKIAEKPKYDQKEWHQEKKYIQQGKAAAKTEINNLHGVINNTTAFAGAISLHQQGGEKASLAHTKVQNCPRRFNNIDEVVSILTEASILHEEALSLAQRALHLISPYPDEESKNTLRQAINNYQAAASEYKQNAIDWPATVLTEKTAAKHYLANLQKERSSLEATGSKNQAKEKQNEIDATWEQLINSGLEEDDAMFQEERAKLKSTAPAPTDISDNMHPQE